MKIAPGVFWGLLFVFVGLSIIIRILFDISLFRIFLGLFLVFIGVLIISGKKDFLKSKKKEFNNFFDQGFIRQTPEDKNEYNVIFGSSRFDFSEFIFKDEKPVRIEVNAIFGSAEIKIPKNIPVRIKMNAVFSGGSLPDNQQVVFGTSYYTSPSYNRSEKHFFIEGNVVFGNLVFL
jgi:predicted membrane protein